MCSKFRRFREKDESSSLSIPEIIDSTESDYLNV